MRRECYSFLQYQVGDHKAYHATSMTLLTKAHVLFKVNQGHKRKSLEGRAVSHKMRIVGLFLEEMSPIGGVLQSGILVFLCIYVNAKGLRIVVLVPGLSCMISLIAKYAFNIVTYLRYFR